MNWKTSSILFLLIIIGMMILTMTACSSRKYESNVHEINEEVNSISIKTATPHIELVPSDDGMCKVVCYEEAKERHSIEVQNGTLTINVLNDKKWYDYIVFNIDSPKITMYRPKAEYSSLVIEGSTGDIEIAKDFVFKNIDVSISTGDVKCYASAEETIKIATNTGNIYMESISATSLDLMVSTGRVTVSDIVCKNFTSQGDTGDISLKNVISTEKISIERETGDVTLEASDAVEIFITTDTGDVKGSLLTDKVFITKTDTGRINVPNSITGGRCEITTDTGDIKISILDD